MAKRKVLLAGESWVSTATHIKGFDQFSTVTFHLGAEPLVAALAQSPYDLTYMPAHEAQAAFPSRIEDLQQYSAVILSDIGANTLLLHPDTWIRSKPTPNRLKLLREYVRAGGGLMMVGGYYSFQGINGGARFRGTAVEEVLPVEILPYDDRLEIPEGFRPEIVAAGDHPILSGLGTAWPLLLGANEVKAKPDATILARLPAEEGGHPLLALGRYGRGRSIAWTSDIGPHWLPTEFAEWSGYARLWTNCLDWLCGEA